MCYTSCKKCHYGKCVDDLVKWRTNPDTGLFERKSLSNKQLCPVLTEVLFTKARQDTTEVHQQMTGHRKCGPGPPGVQGSHRRSVISNKEDTDRRQVKAGRQAEEEQCAWPHFCVEPKNAERRQKDRCWGLGLEGQSWQRKGRRWGDAGQDTKFQVGEINSRVLLHNTVTTIYCAPEETE